MKRLMPLIALVLLLALGARWAWLQRSGGAPRAKGNEVIQRSPQGAVAPPRTSGSTQGQGDGVFHALPERVAERKKAVQSVLARVIEHYRLHIEPWMNHDHEDPCGVCLAHEESDADEKFARLQAEYTQEAFRDLASILALHELVRESSDPELRHLACLFFNYAYLTPRADKEMSDVLLSMLAKVDDAGVFRIVSTCIVALRKSGFTEDQLRLIMTAVDTSEAWKGYGSPALITALAPYVGRAEVRDYLIQRALQPGGRTAAAAANLLSRLHGDPQVYQVLTGLLDREDNPAVQDAALHHMSRGLHGVHLGPANPFAADYVGRLSDLYSRTQRKKVRETIARRIVQFDLPSAAEVACRILRDQSLEEKARSMALS